MGTDIAPQIGVSKVFSACDGHAVKGLVSTSMEGWGEASAAASRSEEVRPALVSLPETFVKSVDCPGNPSGQSAQLQGQNHRVERRARRRHLGSCLSAPSSDRDAGPGFLLRFNSRRAPLR